MLHFKLLGTAAGGGFPQWNCACQLCDLCRKQPLRAAARLQLQSAISSDGENWFLLNASPDLRSQIEATPELQPVATKGQRNTPIRAIILTSADLDQVLGLLLLREFQPLLVYATSVVRQTLQANSFFRMLDRLPGQITWIDIRPNESFPLADSQIVCTPIPLPGALPFYASTIPGAPEGEASIGLLLECEGKRIAYTPSVPEVTDNLRHLYRSCEAIMMDATFWSDTELNRLQTGTPLARSIGHVPLGGEDGTLALLSNINVPTKVLIHINNSNPILDPLSAEHEETLRAGWQIGHDGWELTLHPSSKAAA
ncbi:pyrroloquinoline quinone biosynthesis protein PqqB [Terriglobus saanensis]|uniref:Coenzyme PQQ synthesis protein B n=1 Tax=Terriglobus saanensis (strain ATCC BAA-1853 / DSM 23119 / SP1PR4) TaxID=401053 RepID=E8V7X5_TERSS|nr:MBL fold metallo-hydrolase [Terriglobus saanensis]ADV82899.1 pyrroloquinoline quinone biosynthesis protein PqqB [Terriglobus saanensis SP1PR4]